MSSPVPIVFVGPHRWKAYSVFNGNAYPSYIRPVVEACATRYALLLIHTTTMPIAIQHDIADFKKEIENNRSDLERNIKSRPDLTLVAVYGGLAHLAEMHSALSMMKSFLDVYAILMGRLIGKLINPPYNGGFNKGKIGGQEVSGGKLITVLRKSKQQSLTELADLTLEHSQNWISEAVRYRDRLSHRSNLDDMEQMQLPLHSTAPYIDFCELVRPAMPNGQDLEEYLNGIQRNLASYVCDSISLLPNVDLTLISPESLLTV